MVKLSYFILEEW